MGELQKRIKELLEPVEIEYDPIRKISTTTFDIHRLLEKIDMIVEEAKKEFPQLNKETYVSDIEDNTEEIYNWFKKWFGGEGEK